VAARALTDEPE